MLISEILLEYDKYGRTTVIDRAKFEELKPQLAVALAQAEKGNRIYRGSPNAAPIVITDPTTAERISRNTSNEFTLLITYILPSWKNYPKRTRSIICSEDYHIAAGYARNGAAYIVLPIGDPVVGIAPSNDIWDSFKISPPEFNSFFAEAVERFRKFFPTAKLPYEFNTAEDVMTVLNAFDQAVKTNPNKAWDWSKDMEYIGGWGTRSLVGIMTSGNCVAGLDAYFGAAANGFDAVPLSKYESGRKRELWISSPAVLIKEDYFNQIMN